MPICFEHFAGSVVLFGTSQGFFFAPRRCCRRGSSRSTRGRSRRTRTVTSPTQRQVALRPVPRVQGRARRGVRGEVPGGRRGTHDCARRRSLICAAGAASGRAELGTQRGPG
jgi:hypothetical protein